MHLYMATNGFVAAVDPATGREVWRTALKDGAALFSSTLGSDVCILEHEGRVFAGCKGHLFCLDGASGRVLWHNDLKGLGHDDVTLAMAGKSVQFITTVERKR
jgi:outer membrane protein assembly factor BamB